MAYEYRDRECMDCGQTGKPVVIAFDDPEFGVVAGYVCVDSDACDSDQE